MNQKYKPQRNDLWNDEEFINRDLNDQKRISQFKIDEKFLKAHVAKGRLCDVGCSTGEFIKYINWNGDCYGIEINDYARKKASEFISFENDIFTEEDFFDVVIFRGTIQHVDEPFRFMKMTYKSLKKGGYVIFLATPNSDSILYKIKNNLPFLDWRTNFYIPGKKDLCNALCNFGFEIINIEYPYLKTPYASLFSDHFKFILNCFSKKFYKHAFWKSSINLAAKKI